VGIAVGTASVGDGVGSAVRMVGREEGISEGRDVG
jgi:hypothetical protein